jgi:signal transduction histidine kinase
VAHDFNNLLTAILSYGQLALGKLDAAAPARSELEQLCRAGESAVALTRQLLAFSRKSPLDIRPVDLNAVIETMKPLLSRLLGPEVEIITRLDAAAGAVLADVGGLEQILLNLALNSRDAMQQGGRLSFTTSRVAPGRSTPSRGSAGVEEHVTLLVSDSGTGIDPEILPRIFEPFFTTKEPGRGTGLGLSTVYGIVRQTGGAVTVTSERNQGATFSVLLPALSGDPA